jgi:hypothetical protein
MDKTNDKELLKFILDSIGMIKKRFDGIRNKTNAKTRIILSA